MKKLIVVLVAFPLLGACAAATPPERSAMWGYKKNPNMSEALNIATAVGLNNKTAPMKDNAAPVVRSRYKPSALRKVGTVAVAAGSAVEGIMTAGNAALNIGSILEPTDIDNPQADDWGWAFLPADKAANVADAATYVRQAMRKAMLSALEKQGFKPGPVVSIQLPGLKKDVSTILNEKCNASTFVCTVGAGITADKDVLDHSWTPGVVLVNSSPYFSSSNQAWFLRTKSDPGYFTYIKNSGSGVSYGFGGTNKGIGVDNDRFWRDVTKRLPWLWIYHGTKYVPIGPMIYHNGHVLRFIKPVRTSQQAAAK